ncbi:cell morphogenesis protein [Niveomyces insectorum RCEF 264]|uniref:Cell morphogenesis protein n=1 Tax=Niveomyces insectorum RCEF 264 TaxID=1081102 RepID=A0A167NTB8_9HYPO|nr:cell morphogenesis protein [Niveomyces insectorum RCEF 264]
MDRLDRLDRSGLPLGATIQSSSAARGLPENPAQGRRVPVPTAGNTTVPLPPVPASLATPAGVASITKVAVPPPPPPPPPPSPPPSTMLKSTLTASAPIAASQVIALAREAMKDALRHTGQQVGDDDDVSNELKPGLTIDLSRKNIQRLPDEVVDIIMNKLERLALSHNKLSGFPVRFSECSSLRYLNVRNNDIRDFPLPLCDLRSLEILDLGRNKLRVLPQEIVKLTSLKVFAVQKNRIEDLPVCLADMASLQMLKLDGNPIRFPPPEVFQVQANTPPNEGYLKESEVAEVTITAHVKRFLKQAALSGRADAAGSSGAASVTTPTPGGGSSSGPSSGSGSGSGLMSNGASSAMNGGADTPTDDPSESFEPPRFLPPKRVTSGRFPIKVNGAEVGDLRSPPNGQSRPPPIPTRSHYRGLSQQNTAVRRPGVMPLTIGSVNERVRSNSETTLLPAPRGDRPGPGERAGERSRRMGIVSKKAQELGTLDEVEVNNRFSHYRGLSHGSAMQGNPASGTAAIAADAKSPASPVSDPAMQRPIYVRRLSILPERRRESKVCDPVIEAAKGVLYSVFQIHPMIQMLMSLANDGTTRRSSLEIVFYNTNSHVQQLEREIQRHDMAVDADEAGNLENETVHRACITLLHAYDHICSLLKGNVDLFLDNGDPRYMRTLLLQLYHSIMELRVASADTVTTHGYRKSMTGSSSERATTTAAASNKAAAVSLGDTIKPMLPPSLPHSRDTSVMSTPTAERPGLAGPRGVRAGSLSHNPSNLRVATDVPLPGLAPFINGAGRTATITSATPRSGESFASAGSRGPMAADSFTEEDRMFERIFLSLQTSTDVAMRVLPGLSSQYAAALRAAMAQRAPERVTQDWRILLSKCTNAIQHTETLKGRLSNVKLKEPGIRWQDAYWGLCVNFFAAWLDFVDMIREPNNTIQLPSNMRTRLRPLHQCIKDTVRLILRSPWSYILRQSSRLANVTSPLSGGSTGSVLSGGSGGGGGSGGSSQQMQLPMTPQSAALGPAVQATVPSTPQSASFANAFSGNVFERADALISSGGISMSRTGTFSSMSGSVSLNSISSTLSSHADTTFTPSSMLSPGPLGPLPFRLNNGSKVAF